MRKWTVMLAILSLAGTTTMAANLDMGTKEIQLTGGVDFDTAADTEFDIGIGYGYFIRDQWEVLGSFGLTDNELLTTWAVGVSTEYNWDLGTEIVPYVGVGVLGSGTDLDQGDSSSAAVFQASVGSKYFMRDSVAPFIALDWRVASDDIYLEKDGVSDNEFALTWGIRFYFD